MSGQRFLCDHYLKKIEKLDTRQPIEEPFFNFIQKMVAQKPLTTHFVHWAKTMLMLFTDLKLDA